MDLDDKEFYNQASEAKLGWKAHWFGGKENDETLIPIVMRWQKKRRLTADGLVGPVTFRRAYTEQQARQNKKEESVVLAEGEKAIVYNGKKFPIKWDKVVLWTDENPGIELPKRGSYYEYNGDEDRKIDFFVNHWDATLSAKHCSRILNKRNLSVHFCLDNDGTIYQLVDMQHAAKHAGKANRKSVGVEISNAFYPKYQKYYVRQGLGERPVLKDVKVHGRKLQDFTGFYPVQLEALKALWVAVSEATGIPLESPLHPDGNPVEGVHRKSARGAFNGFISHYHISRRKIDCAGLEIHKMIEEIKNES